jgi:hypothetical protein
MKGEGSMNLSAIHSSSTSDVSSFQQTSSSEDGVQEFMNYAKETPAQRMFDSWLESQNMTMDQYNAMSPAEKQKILTEFEIQMKQKLRSEFSSASTSIAA